MDRMGLPRGAKPLFDLIPERDGKPAQPAPTVRFSPKPARPGPEPVSVAEARPAPVESFSPPVQDEPVPTFRRSEGLRAVLFGGPAYAVPANLIYIGSALLILILLLTWIGGVKRGRALEAQRLDPFIRAAGPGVTEPDALPPGPSGLQQGGQPQGGQAGPRQNDAARQQQPAPQPRTPVPGDPRESGLNYYMLATLTRPEAERAVTFLAQNGVDSFAIASPVDRRAGDAKNPDPSEALFELYALPGVSGDEYRRKATKMTNLEAAVARLGPIWQKDHKGSSNFARAFWKKHQ